MVVVALIVSSTCFPVALPALQVVAFDADQLQPQVTLLQFDGLTETTPLFDEERNRMVLGRALFGNYVITGMEAAREVVASWTSFCIRHFTC